MNFMGMGIVELGVIFLVAFLVMGPGKSIEMAKATGKVLRDIRRVVNEVAASADLSSAVNPPATNKEPSPTPPPGAVPQQPSDPTTPVEHDERP